MKNLVKKPSFFAFPFQKKKDDFPKIALPKVRNKVFPGPQSVKLTEQLKRYECPQITYVGGVFPIFFKKAHGANIIDVDGNRFLDFSSSFAVTGIGHSSKAVLQAMKKQAELMIHGMGDVHPNEIKILLAKRLSEITPGNLSQTIFSSSGFEAVESALKTAVMATKKTGVIAFEGSYHGLGYGTLNVTHREDFRKPFAKQVPGFGYFAPFPDTRTHGSKATEVSMKAVKNLVKKASRTHRVGAVIVEPIQGRGGVMVPPQNFLPELRHFCNEESILLIADEIFTGFGRTGSMFAVEKSNVVPDILCLGKGMAAGFPVSACIGTARIMHSWGQSTGESLHTSTFLGWPLGCAVALAVIQEIEQKKLADRSRQMGEYFRKKLYELKQKYAVIGDVRGSGLMIGMEFVDPLSKKPLPAPAKAKQFVEESLRAGIILLPCGPHHNVISITPPFIISEREIDFSITVFDKILKKLA